MKRDITRNFQKLLKAGLRNHSEKKKTRGYWHLMVKETAECVQKKERPEKPIVPDLPKSIVSIPKPDKTAVIENQCLRFGN